MAEIEREEDSKEKESKAEAKQKTRGSRSQRAANLYTFLTSAWVNISPSVCCVCVRKWVWFW